MNVINGYIFCNQPGLDTQVGATGQRISTCTLRTTAPDVSLAQVGDDVRWYIAGLGSEHDIHSIHWHGNTVCDRHTHRCILCLPMSKFSDACTHPRGCTTVVEWTW